MAKKAQDTHEEIEPEPWDNVDWRAWSVEQAIKMQAPHSVTSDAVLTEAQKLLDFVLGEPK